MDYIQSIIKLRNKEINAIETKNIQADSSTNFSEKWEHLIKPTHIWDQPLYFGKAPYKIFHQNQSKLFLNKPQEDY